MLRGVICFRVKAIEQGPHYGNDNENQHTAFRADGTAAQPGRAVKG